MNKIALALDGNKELAGFFSVKEIVIYRKSGSWEATDRFPAEIDSTATAAKIRQSVEQIGINITDRDCSLIVGKEIIGVPYHVLCRLGIEVCEADEISEELFDEINEDFFAQKTVQEEHADIPPHPIPVDDEGNYYIDFPKVSKCYPELTSKKILVPFLANDLYYSLTIDCEHVMPWLDGFVQEHQLVMESRKKEGIYQVLIAHKVCEG